MTTCTKIKKNNPDDQQPSNLAQTSLGNGELDAPVTKS